MDRAYEAAVNVPATRPFVAEPSGMNTYVIRDEDGAVFAWIVGEANARRVVGSLNLVYDCGLIE